MLISRQAEATIWTRAYRVKRTAKPPSPSITRVAKGVTIIIRSQTRFAAMTWLLSLFT
jgi:hypothetical protein